MFKGVIKYIYFLFFHITYASNGFERLRDTDILYSKRVKVFTIDLSEFKTNTIIQFLFIK